MINLTARERVNRMFARQDHDRIPRQDTYWGETIARWQSEGLRGDAQTVLNMLEHDFQGLQWLWPTPYPGQHKVVAETDETRDICDAHGKVVRYWKNKSGTPEHLGFACDSREKWETEFKPAMRSTGLQVDPPAVVRAYRQARETEKWCHLTGVESFEQTRALMGDEVTLIAMAEDPEWVADVSRTHTDIMLQNFDAIMATGIQPDGLWIYGDMAFRNGTMCSPAMYRKLIWPDHKRLADWAHAHNMKFIYHTDGDIRGVLHLHAEAGFDMLQPLEAKASMDIRELAPKHRDLAWFGNIDMTVAGTNDLEALEHEVRTKIETGKSVRGYAYHSDHSVPPTVSWHTYQFIVELLNRYGKYQ